MSHRELYELLALVAVPAVMGVCTLLGVEYGALASLAVLLCAFVAIARALDRSRPMLRQLMPTVVLGAVAAAGRMLFAPIPDVKPVSAICIVAGATLGPSCGFGVGALAALVSNMFFGQGPWTPWQMYGWGLIGYLSGLFARSGLLERAWVRNVWAFMSAMLYGFILNGWYVLGFVRPLTWQGALAGFAAGFPLDVVHGIATVLFLAGMWGLWHRAIERVVAKYGLG